MAEDRYSRQKKIQGWNQEKLENSQVAVIGSGPLANFTGSLLSALGVGRLTFFHSDQFKEYTPEEFCYADLLKGDMKVRGLENSASQINSTIDVDSYVWNFQRNYLADILGNPEVIVDTTNNPLTEAVICTYSMRKGIPLVNASAADHYGELSIFRPNGDFLGLSGRDHLELTDNIPFQLLSNDYNIDMPQDNVISSLIAGLAVDEVRKILMPLKTRKVRDEKTGEIVEQSLEPTLEGKLIYDSLTDKLIHKTNSLKPNIEPDYKPFDFRKDTKVGIVGAGSLGNVVGLLLAVNGIEDIQIYDDDIVEDVNLNRQIMFSLYGSDVGRKKSTSLANKLMKINPSVKVHAVDGLFMRDTAFKGEKKPDVIFDCVDRYVGMEEVDEYAKANNIPVITGHTDFKEGQAFYSHPQAGYACLDNRLNVREEADMERNPTSCIAQSNPSVIVSNWIIGSLMVDIYRRAFSKDSKVKPIDTLIKYNSLLSNRISTSATNTICPYKNPESPKHNDCPHIGSCEYNVEA